MIQNPPQATQFLETETAPEQQIDFRKYLALLFKYKWAIISMAFLGGLIGLYMAIKAVPVYVAQARLQIQPDTSTSVLANPLGMYNFKFYETQYQMLRSYGVAELAAEELGLLNFKESAPPTVAVEPAFNWRDWLPDALRTPVRTLSLDEKRANRINALRGSVQVRPVAGSQLVDILIYNTNPQVAADRVNVITESYIGFLNDTKFQSLQIDQNWYRSRLDDARNDLDVANQDVQDFYELNGLLRGGTNEGGASLQQRQLLCPGFQLVHSTSLATKARRLSQ